MVVVLKHNWMQLTGLAPSGNLLGFISSLFIGLNIEHVIVTLTNQLVLYMAIDASRISDLLHRFPG